MKLSRSFLLLALLLVPALAPSALALQSAADDLEKQAEQRFAADDLVGAEQLYREAALLSDGRERARLLVHASWLQHLMGNRARAAETMSEVLSVDPDHPFRPELYSDDFVALYRDALERRDQESERRAALAVNQAAAAIEQGRLGEARSLLDSVLAERPDDLRARFNLGLLEQREGNLELALGHFERILTRTAGPDPLPIEPELLARVHAAVGRLHLARDLPLDASVSLEKALALDPAKAEWWSELGLARMENGELDPAIAAFERARALAPENIAVLDNLAIAQLDAGAGAEAARTLEDALALSPDDPALWLNLALARAASGEPDDRVVAALERGLASAGADSETRRSLLDTLLPRLAAQQRWADLLDASRQRLELGDSASAWSFRGFAELQLDRPAEATRSLERSLELDPERADTANNLGNAWFALGRYSEAAAAFARALEIDPGLEVARRNYEAAQQRSGGSVALPRGAPGPPGAATGSGAPAAAELGLRLENDRDAASGLSGSRVVDVAPGSRAERAGLRAGDLLVRFEGRPAPVAVELLESLKRPSETPYRLDVLRDGEALRIELP